MNKYISTGLSLPRDFIKKIDEERGDIPRSRFIFRLLEKIYRIDDRGEENL